MAATIDAPTVQARTAPRRRRVLRPRTVHREDPTATWREEVFTRANELWAQLQWLGVSPGPGKPGELADALDRHLKMACRAAEQRPRRVVFCGALRGRAKSNLDAAEANLLQLSPPEYLAGQMPSLLNHVQRHLPRNDPRRIDFERIARRVGVASPTRGPTAGDPLEASELGKAVHEERKRIVSTVRAASSASLREQLRLQNFRNVVLATAGVLTLLAVGLGLLGMLSPDTVPLCFNPAPKVVCPTAEASTDDPTVLAGAVPVPTVWDTAGKLDLFTVELIGMTAAAVAAAAALRHARGTSDPYGLSVSLALLKLPTGAVTAVLGIVLMRGEFVPGLTDLDSSAQILAWALLFGYAQQLFTRLVDQQAQTVQASVRGADKAA